MAEAKRRDDWDHTAQVLWLIASVNRDPKKTRPYKVQQFHPFYASKQSGISREAWWKAVASQATKGRR